MKRVTLTTVIILFLGTVYAQKTEFRAQLNSGFFSFTGNGSEKSSFILNSNELLYTGYTNNPYGAKMGSCIGVSGNITRAGKHNFLYGTDLGFEILRSKTDIKSVSTNTTSYSASGETFLVSKFINLYPYFGYRLINKKTKLDFTGGLDVAFCLQTKEKGSAIAYNGNSGILYITSQDRKTINTDFRPRFQLAASYKKMGVYAGYSFGIKNYLSNYLGFPKAYESYSSYLRLGLTYQFH